MKTVRLAFTFLLAVVLFVPQGASADDAKKKKTPPKRRPNPAMAKVEDVAGLPRVLLIGDSATLGSDAFYAEFQRHAEATGAYHSAWAWG